MPGLAPLNHAKLPPMMPGDPGWTPPLESSLSAGEALKYLWGGQ
jgi:hypothetical protein